MSAGSNFFSPLDFKKGGWKSETTIIVIMSVSVYRYTSRLKNIIVIFDLVAAEYVEQNGFPLVLKAENQELIFKQFGYYIKYMGIYHFILYQRNVRLVVLTKYYVGIVKPVHHCVQISSESFDREPFGKPYQQISVSSVKLTFLFIIITVRRSK